VVDEQSPEPKSGARPAPPRAAADDTANHRLARQRRAWQRRLWLDCGCSAPCRCEHRNNPTAQRVDGYRAAVEHLSRHQLHAAALAPELRQLWRRGGSDRRMAETVVRRWNP